jgi:hypothetical protein
MSLILRVINLQTSLIIEVDTSYYVVDGKQLTEFYELRVCEIIKPSAKFNNLT